MTEPFHRGETAVQGLAGERAQAILNGRVVSPVVPAAARPFVGQQSTIAIGRVDAAGRPWATLVVGDPGFASCDEAGTVVTIHPTGPASSIPPFDEAVRPGDAIGMLVIDLVTRRRLRVNGVVEQTAGDEWRVGVEQAYPNCPKYIQRRERVQEAPRPAAAAVVRGSGAPPDLSDWLSRTDTAFVASVGPDGRIDCSHRGGRRGYMRMEGDAVLVPDYPGNSMFCTLGNMFVEPRAGLVLVDFEARRQLHLTGDAWVQVAGPEQTDRTDGTGRRWRLRPVEWATSPLSGPAAWRLVDESPFNPALEP